MAHDRKKAKDLKSKNKSLGEGTFISSKKCDYFSDYLNTNNVNKKDIKWFKPKFAEVFTVNIL